MRVLVVTSCTGEKRVTHERQLTLDDLRRGGDHLAERERELAAFLTPAEELYTGQQHKRLMRGVERVRRQRPGEIALDLWILSAGFGLVPGDRPLPPYNVTFSGMPKREARAWANELGIPERFRDLVRAPYDLGVVLLSDEYLDAVAVGPAIALGGATIFLVGQSSPAPLADVAGARRCALGVDDTRRFGSGYVGLKGEVGGRLLTQLADAGDLTACLLPDSELLSRLAAGPATLTRGEPKVRRVTANPDVDWVIDPPLSWRQRTGRARLRYFVPDWDDRVDPDYDFRLERHAGGAADWTNEVYAHQLYPAPNYDGILVSRATVDESARKRQMVYDLGIHRYLRVPRELPVLGDCGAFSYVGEENPPYTTADVLDYYTNLGFDYGVSVDHLLFVGDEAERRRRYDLTIENAEAFLQEHRARGLTWEPIGAVQGWDPASYAAAAAQYAKMGYTYIAIGGMVRSRDREILAVLSAVHEVVPPGMRRHLLGVARPGALAAFARYGVVSVDSASALRSSWMSATANYLTRENGWYTAIRIPSTATKRLADAASFAPRVLARLAELEQACLEGVRAYAVGIGGSVDRLVDDLLAYSCEFKQFNDRVRAGHQTDKGVESNNVPTRPDEKMRARLTRTLTERAWTQCDCPLCQDLGVELLIFRGNNRNRRRGFHNTHVFYQLMEDAVDGVLPAWLGRLDGIDTQQLALALQS